MARTVGRRRLLAVGCVAMGSWSARAQGGGARHIGFDDVPAGSLPPGMVAALTGGGGPVAWQVLDDATAPVGRKVLAQTSTDATDLRFPLVILDQPRLADLEVAVSFKPLAGKVDRAAGIAVRLADPANYYVVRANALEDNVRLYKVVHGQRIQFAGADAKVASLRWQELRLRLQANRFDVWLDGRSLFSATDSTFAEAGRIALWTKADSVTSFNDLALQAL